MQPNGMIFWDWNGTLMDDVDFTHECLNWMLETHGYPQRYDLAAYRELFGFPIEDYYRCAGFDFARHPYPELAARFMEHYNAGVPGCAVTAHAVDTLQTLTRMGWQQAVLSASRRDYLIEQVSARGLQGFFTELLGLADIYGVSKVQLGTDYLRRTGIDPAACVMVGDTDHDAAVAAAIIDMVIGMSYGLISGYFGGRVDMVMQRFLEVANGIPRLVIVTLLLLVLQPGMVTIIFALMLTEWVGMSRIARAEMLKLKDQEFVLASRTLGAGSFFIIFKEVLPNIIGPIITQVMFSIPTAIFTEAFLSFVGLGIPVPQCSLGSLISELYNSFTTHPYQIIPPIVVMSLLMLSFNLVADGLREALDPKMKSM
jgi:phosphoglycolate phosphatase